MGCAKAVHKTINSTALAKTNEGKGKQTELKNMPIRQKGKNIGNATIEVGDYFLLPNHRSMANKESLLVRVVQVLDKFPDKSDIRYVLCSEDYLLRGAYYADELTDKVAIVEEDEQFPMLSTYTGAKSAPFHVCMRLYRQKLKLLKEHRKIADDLNATMEEKQAMIEQMQAEMSAARDNEIKKTQTTRMVVSDGRTIPDHTYQLESDEDDGGPNTHMEAGEDVVARIKKEKFDRQDATMGWAGLEDMGLNGDGFYFGGNNSHDGAAEVQEVVKKAGVDDEDEEDESGEDDEGTSEYSSDE
ncbi:hypothetical protein BJ508DRAFT_330505 [Ascobolus immersus RN42]|uniref:Uncharacterized protein n=1 Tax=Ascobolus immersus RN42 TaxID=1160509 RepID=A0A3N4HT99_ASCIM|nr:hypothetical protein BJ508DRAFT_330505 [Ascobolus immersus RN42]